MQGREDAQRGYLDVEALQGLSDRETAEALTFDLRWKAACGYGLNETAFHPTTLTYWRKRLAASPDPHRIMKAIAEVVAETGVLKGRSRRALDSTVLDDAVARQDTITQLIAGIRRFGREVPGGKNLLAAHAGGYDYTRTGKPEIAWDDADAKEALVSALVTDALALLAAVDPTSWMVKRPMRTRCWRSWPGRTSNRPRIRTARTGGGGSPARSPRTG